MTDVITGRYGPLMLANWIGTAPDGRERAYLFLWTPGASGTPRSDSESIMAIIARKLGTVPGQIALIAPAGLSAAVDAEPDAAGDQWVSLKLPGGEPLSTLVDTEWAQYALDQRRVVLCVGTQVALPGEDLDDFIDRTFDSAGIVLVPATPSAEGGHSG